MKKILMLLLAGLMLLTACNNVIDEVSDESLAEEGEGGTYRTLVSVGKPYTINTRPTEEYPDLYEQQLTDGQKTSINGAHYVDSRMVGFTSNCIMQIDLGDDGKRIEPRGFGRQP